MPNARELVRFLCANGYVESRQTGSHLILKHTERKMLAVPMHRGKDLPKGLFLRILKDAGFTLEEFRAG
ncbi:MAG: type II toxin-antitoxin system HicA family toxin [Candidatus Acidiferrum sp.]